MKEHKRRGPKKARTWQVQGFDAQNKYVESDSAYYPALSKVIAQEMLHRTREYYSPDIVTVIIFEPKGNIVEVMGNSTRR